MRKALRSALPGSDLEDSHKLPCPLCGADSPKHTRLGAAIYPVEVSTTVNNSAVTKYTINENAVINTDCLILKGSSTKLGHKGESLAR